MNPHLLFSTYEGESIKMKCYEMFHIKVPDSPGVLLIWEFLHSRRIDFQSLEASSKNLIVQCLHRNYEKLLEVDVNLGHDS